MSGHTPGPWTLETVGDKCKHLCPAKDGMSILTIAIEEDEDGEPNYFGAVWEPADARLIAAAPDMYESGKEMAEAVALLSADDGRILGLLPILCRLRQALAKAEGRE